MFSFLGRMFGSSDAGTQLITNAAEGIDKLFYTDEEKAEDARTAKREVMGTYMAWLDSTTGSRIARRFLAVGCFSIWAMEHMTAVIMRVLSNWFGDMPDGDNKLAMSADFLTVTASDMQTLVGIVFAFYFGGPVLVDASANMLKKWTGTQDTSKAQG